VAQRQMRARETGHAEPHGIEAQKRKAGFLERLAHVGLGRREPEDGPEELYDEPRLANERMEPQWSPREMEADDFGYEEPAAAPRPAPRRRPADAGPQRPAMPTPRANQAAAMRLDAEDDDDQLEIPAFLRRQAN